MNGCKNECVPKQEEHYSIGNDGKVETVVIVNSTIRYIENCAEENGGVCQRCEEGYMLS